MAPNSSQIECFELFMVDISTSMKKHDGFWNFFGKTRFELAKQILNGVLKDRKQSKTINVALLVYDTSSAKRFDFCHITNKEIQYVNELKPAGPTTATYDAYKESIDYLKKDASQSAQERRIIIITDGGDNNSNPENVSKYANIQISLEKQNFMLRTILLQTSTNSNGSKQLAHELGWEYKQIRKDNVDLVTKSYLIDYPSEYTGMNRSEREKTKNFQATMERAPIPPQTAPILHEHTSSKTTNIGKILLTETILE
ncbi:unnamed protein product [Rotaria socialis]|uniref:VWFA domain-containing protein n=1 Tax=Rotaria socialis TaxID=392032 RepID=A0A817TXY7_9BILA|nr:unnamed protein product [Rotaria socialis]CAF3322495.1 unnamed protein product [Rotaria socialis]CAF3467034.1 unnamed protein product [Rotaria socialis]CAF3490797.1 unnamed protein product [Rotaria socialis]CAF4272570.1 unnamed protein product [Rotaria socialis]